MRCLLIGNYGVNNLGDEALRDYFLQTFPDIEWIVVSAHPQNGEVPRLPLGLRSFFSFHWIKTVRAYRHADAVVFGGGSLFTDVESLSACFLWGTHAAVARLFGKPVLLACQGIGPFRTRMGQGIARWVVHRAQFLSIRDQASAKRVTGWSMNTKIIQTFDPVFSLMQKQKVDHQSKNVFTIIPRANSSDRLMSTALTFLRMHPIIHHVQVLLMQNDDVAEQAIARRLERELGLPATIVPMHTIHDLMQSVSGSAMVMTQRFHGALAALAAGIEVDIIAQGEGDKLAELRDLVARGFDAAVARMLIDDGERALRESLHA